MTERTALVTGCSSGFGLGIAQALVARGWTVLAGMRDPARAPAQLAGAQVVPLDLADDAQIAAVAARGVRAGAQVVPLDLADDAQIAAVAARVDRLDCLVNNAGFALNGPFATYSADQMRRQMQVNVLGPAFLTQQLLPALASARGRVINVSSVAGELGLPMNALYCATKFAVEGLSESLRHELADHGVQVALVEPGGYRTAFARNMVWGERPLPAGGRDAQQLAAYRRMQERLLARPGKDPAAVVRAVLRLAEMETIPMRTRVGADARSASFVRRWLPQKLAVVLVGALFRRKLAAERDE